MRSQIAFAILLATLCAGPGARAQAAQPVTGSSGDAPPALKAALQPFSFLVGQWDCDGEFLASKKQISAHVSFTPDLDGSWLAFRWDDLAPNKFHAMEFWGYNKTAKHFSNFIYDNYGGARLFESKGWDADMLIWSGDMLPSASGAETQINQRFVLERKSPKEFVISYDTRKPQADWSTMDRLSCKQK